jgi:hypothetical protein
MIYSPNSAVDQQMLTQSRELVREALALLRDSDHLVSGQRLRDELQQERHKRPPRSQLPMDDQDRRAKASQMITARHRTTAA